MIFDMVANSHRKSSMYTKYTSGFLARLPSQNLNSLSKKNVETNKAKLNFVLVKENNFTKIKNNKRKGEIKMDYTNIKEKMNKTISVFSENLAEVRAGRANPAILNKIKVDYYGVQTPINQVAGISVPEARLIVIQPWDVSILKEIEKEILKSDIGINPNNDGKVIRLNFPELNEERRKQIVKDIRKTAEEAKIAIRSIRRDGMEEAKKLQKDGEMTEDELKVTEEEIQKLTDTMVSQIDSLLEDKEKEIMTV